MDLIFDSKTILSDQQYLEICSIVQMTHSLVSADLHDDIYIDGIKVTRREWRAIKRSYYVPISQVMHNYEREKHKLLKLLSPIAKEE